MAIPARLQQERRTAGLWKPRARVRLRYLGAARNDAWLHTRCAAINLRTLLRHGLTRQEGAWVLA